MNRLTTNNSVCSQAIDRRFRAIKSTMKNRLAESGG
jgi:hypothetical protein